MKKEKIFIFICLVLLSACSSSLDGIVIEKAADGYKLSIDGRETYIKGVGGTYRLDIAAQSGANAFRTWGGNVEEIKKNLALASEHNMYVMQGIGMTKDSIRYYDDEYKNKMREEVRLLAETFKNDTSLLAWGIGNEIELGNANIAAAWNFVEELAQLIKSIDKRHLVSTVISYNPSALDSVAKYAPSLDYVGSTLEIANTSDFKQKEVELRHPYTKALYKALPNHDFVPIDDKTQPLPNELPKGCVFSDRCPLKDKNCENQVPKIREIRNGKVRCIHAT